MNNLSTAIAYYSLFRKKICENHALEEFVPQNCFGVFSSIRRPNGGIHGCIGYWTSNFRELSPAEVIDHLQMVSARSVYDDTRRLNFSALEKDPLTQIELDFMMTPISELRQKDFLSYNNEQLGLIVQTRNGLKKATYLPGVFPQSIDWENISESLKRKAGISEREDVIFYTYRITQAKQTYADILTDGILCYLEVFNVTRRLLDTALPDLKFPLAYSVTAVNTLTWNSTDEVRNVSMMADILEYGKRYPKIIRQYERELIENKIESAKPTLTSVQALSFVASSEDCTVLKKRFGSAERDFEAPQIAIGLRMAGCGWLAEMLDPVFKFSAGDSIFRINWVMKAMACYSKMPELTSEQQKILYRKIDEILLRKQNENTNVLAVAFEALGLYYRFFKDSQGNTLAKLFELFVELEKRQKEIFYTFLDGTARIDITGHVLSGFLQIIK